MDSYCELITAEPISSEKIGIHPETLICYECGDSKIIKCTDGIYCPHCSLFKYYRNMNR